MTILLEYCYRVISSLYTVRSAISATDGLVVIYCNDQLKVIAF